PHSNPSTAPPRSSEAQRPESAARRSQRPSEPQRLIGHPPSATVYFSCFWVDLSFVSFHLVTNLFQRTALGPQPTVEQRQCQPIHAAKPEYFQTFGGGDEVELLPGVTRREGDYPQTTVECRPVRYDGQQKASDDIGHF